MSIPAYCVFQDLGLLKRLSVSKEDLWVLLDREVSDIAADELGVEY